MAAVGSDRLCSKGSQNITQEISEFLEPSLGTPELDTVPGEDICILLGFMW